MKFFLCIFFYFSAIFADIPQFNALDLENSNGDGAYDSAMLTMKIELHPDTEYLNLSGQNVTDELMRAIRSKLPQLKELIMHGSIRHYGERDIVRWQMVTADMLGSLIQENSSIETLDLSLSTLNDSGLDAIGRGAFGLNKISLKGVQYVSEIGLNELARRIPNIQQMDLSKIEIKRPDGSSEKIGPNVSEEFIQQLKKRGISVIREGA